MADDWTSEVNAHRDENCWCRGTHAEGLHSFWETRRNHERAADELATLRAQRDQVLALLDRDNPYLGHQGCLPAAEVRAVFGADPPAEPAPAAVQTRRCGPWEDREGSRTCLKCGDIDFYFEDDDPQRTETPR